MPPRPRHPNKDIEEALQYAESHGWTVIKSGPRAHAWGVMRCDHGQRGGCQFSIYGTPRNPKDHANYLKKQVDKCPH